MWNVRKVCGVYFLKSSDWRKGDLKISKNERN